MEILGIRIDNYSKTEILQKIESYLEDGKFHAVYTINAEIILKSLKDDSYKSILNQSDLNIADSISIRYAFLRFGKWLKCRIAGADLMHEILRMANKKSLSVFLAANKDGLSSYEETMDALSRIYPRIKFSGKNISLSDLGYEPETESYNLILCNFGAPLQEIFINFLKDAKMNAVAMGVGGSFDFVTGKIKRAPASMRILGMEWLWRPFQQIGNRKFFKERWKRIFDATVIFPIKVIFS